jgi:hypothetical protein
MNNLRLISKKTEHRCIGNDYDSYTETYEFTNADKPGGWCQVQHRKAIGKNAGQWRVFDGEGMRQWTEGKNKDIRKLEIERSIKNWFDTNGIEWEATGCEIDYV